MATSISLQVYAEKVQQMQAAKRKYLAKLNAAPSEKKEAWKELKKQEEDVDTLTYAILHTQPSRKELFQPYMHNHDSLTKRYPR